MLSLSHRAFRMNPVNLADLAAKPDPSHRDVGAGAYDEEQAFEKMYQVLKSGQFSSVDISDSERAKKFDEYVRMREREQ